MKLSTTLALIGAASSSLSFAQITTHSFIIPLNGCCILEDNSFITACESGDLESVKTLIEADKDALYSTNLNGLNGLMLACIAGHFALADFLFEQGLSVNAPLLSGDSFMGVLAATNNTKGLEYLLQKGIDIESRDQSGNTPLLSACRHGQKEAALFLLDKGADIKARNTNKLTCLHQSCVSNNVELTKFLIEQGESIDERNVSDYSPLLVAAHYGNAETISYLVSVGANPNDIQSIGMENTALIIACSSEHDTAAAVKALLDAGASPNKANKDHRTPIAHASYTGKLQAMAHLLEHGADINRGQDVAQIPLFWACNWYNLKSIEFLAKNGADLNKTDKLGNTALHYILSTNYDHVQEVVDLLIKYGADVNATNNRQQSPLIIAASKNRCGSMLSLLNAGADINHLDENLGSPLSKAISHHCADAAALLIEAGADVEPILQGWASPLIHACQQGMTEIVALLLEQGASIDGVDQHGFSAGDYARKRNEQKILNLFRIAKADPKELKPVVIGKEARSRNIYNSSFIDATENNNIKRFKQILASGIAPTASRNNDGFQAIHAASKSGNQEIVDILLDLGVSLHAKDLKGNTALHIACENGHLKLLQHLLDKGGKLDDFNFERQSLMHSAAKSGSVELIQFLTEKGLDILVKDKNDETPFMLACASGDISCVQFFLDKGVEIDARNKDGQTVLFYATRERKAPVLLTLLDLGADPNNVDNNGLSCLMTAFQSKKSPFCCAAILVEYGADTTLCDKAGKSTLEYAHEIKEEKSIQLIRHMNHGGELTTLFDAKTLRAHLSFAITTGNTDLLCLLLRMGADPNTANMQAYGPALNEAIYKGNMEIFQLLLKYGSDVHACSFNGSTSVITAVYCGRMEMLKILVEAGVDVNKPRAYTDNPLKVAAFASDVPNNQSVLNKELATEMILYLLDHGADPTKTTDDGKSLLDVISPKTHPTVSAVLKERGYLPKTANNK